MRSTMNAGCFSCFHLNLPARSKLLSWWFLGSVSFVSKAVEKQMVRLVLWKSGQ